MAESRLTYELFGRDKASPVFDKFGRKLDDTNRKMGLLEGGTRRLAGAAAGLIAFSTAADFLRSANDEARESQKVSAQTTQVLKTTGGAAKVTAKEVGDLATRLSMKTAIDDEQVQSSTNLLLTFKQVRNEVGEGAKILDRATAAALDLSASGFGSTDSAAKMLGKSLNDPLKGITALSRAGVTFTAGQREQIKRLVEQNDLLGAQKVILKEVESQVGGQAEAQATAAEKADVAWANVKETIGTALLPTIDRLSEKFVDFVESHDIEGWAKQGADGLEDFMREAEPLARDVLPAIGTSLSIAADAAKTLAPAVQAVVDAFNNMPEWAQTVLVTGALVKGTGIGKLVPSLGAAAAGGAVGAAGRGAIGRSGAQAAASAGAVGPAGVAYMGAAALAGGYQIGRQVKDDLGRTTGPAAVLNRRPSTGTRPDPGVAAEVFEARAKAAEKMAATNARVRAQEEAGWARTFALTGEATDDFTHALDDLGRERPKPKVDLLGAPKALAQIGDVLGDLSGLNRKRAQPRVRVDTDGVTGQIRYVQRMIDGITGKTVGIRIATNGQGGTTTARATGGAIVGPGSGTSDDVLVWGSNGEHMLDTGDVKAMGGQAAVYEFRRKLHEGAGAGAAAVGAAASPTTAGGGAMADRLLATQNALLTEQNQLLRQIASSGSRGNSMRLNEMGG